MSRARMHLCAKVPNEGARRLAWWLGEQLRDDADAITTFATDVREPVGYVDRWLSGELEPAADTSWAISLITDGAVRVPDWRMAAAGGWFDAPAARPQLKDAA